MTIQEINHCDDGGASRLACAIIKRAVLDWCAVSGLSTVGRFGHREYKDCKTSRADLYKFAEESGFKNPRMELRDFFLSDWFRFLAESLGVDVNSALVALGVRVE